MTEKDWWNMTEIVEWCNAKHHESGIVFHCNLPKGHTGSHEEHHKDYLVVWERE